MTFAAMAHMSQEPLQQKIMILALLAQLPGQEYHNFKVLELLPGFNPYKVCAGSNQDISDALDWVTNHANNIDVVNLSLGGLCIIGDVSCEDPIYEDALNNAVNAGVVVVVAGGNEDSDSIDYIPARFDQAITVSAMGDSDGKCGGQSNKNGFKDDNFATFSNYGSAIDIAAPGVDINSTSNNGGYVAYSGTSMAAPTVSGAVALYKSLNADKTVSPSDVIAGLKSLGITSKDKCDSNGKGYFSGDKDTLQEPLLYMGNMTQSSNFINTSSTTNAFQ